MALSYHRPTPQAFKTNDFSQALRHGLSSCCFYPSSSFSGQPNHAIPELSAIAVLGSKSLIATTAQPIRLGGGLSLD
jgi:hypothetical protein